MTSLSCLVRLGFHNPKAYNPTPTKSWLVAFSRMVILRKSRESSVYCGAGPFSWAIASYEFLEHSLQRCFVRVDGVRKFSQLDLYKSFSWETNHFLGSALLAGRVQRWHCLPAERRLLVEMSFSACILISITRCTLLGFALLAGRGNNGKVG